MLWQLLAADPVALLGFMGEGVGLEVLLAAVLVVAVAVAVAAEDVGVAAGGWVVDQVTCMKAQHVNMYLYATVYCPSVDYQMAQVSVRLEIA